MSLRYTLNAFRLISLFEYVLQTWNVWIIPFGTEMAAFFLSRSVFPKLRKLVENQQPIMGTLRSIHSKFPHGASLFLLKGNKQSVYRITVAQERRKGIRMMSANTAGQVIHCKGINIPFPCWISSILSVLLTCYSFCRFSCYL